MRSRADTFSPTFQTGYADPNDPFNNNAQPNSWTPPLNASWTWGKDKANG
jgi:hypothetical protein